MKIAILTQPLYINYGGLLQAYAVQKILRDMGHEVITLDTVGDIRPVSLSLFCQLRCFIVTFICAVIGRSKWKDIYWPYNNNDRNVRFVSLSMRPFLKRIMNISTEISSDEKIKQYCEVQRFDAYLVGSDQVWRPKYSPNIGWFFLNFISDFDKAKRIAFSASFGTSDWEFTDGQTKECRHLAQRFDAISVREQFGVVLCKDYLGVDAVQTLDPTMLLSPTDYAKLIEIDKDNTNSMSHCIFSYVLDENEDQKMIIKNISKTLKLPVQVLAAHIKFAPYTSLKTVMQNRPKPVAQWLRAFQESDFVITDSFHGTVFSILHHLPFVVFENKGRGMSRIETLLETFGLEDRLIENALKCKKEWLMNSIDWDKIDTILADKRRIGMDFLHNALNEVINNV